MIREEKRRHKQSTKAVRKQPKIKLNNTVVWVEHHIGILSTSHDSQYRAFDGAKLLASQGWKLRNILRREIETDKKG